MEPTSAATDRAALEALYRATAGPGWHDNTGWLTAAPMNEWYGVQTDAAGRVTALNLAYNQLDGVIPPELGQLSNLIRLDLQENSLTGTIPPELGELSNLTELLLGNVDLELFIGRLGYGNELSGQIPPALGRLSKLEHLNLSGNGLTGGIPPEFGQLSRLVTVDLSWNPMTGPIPEELTQIPTLERAWVASGMCVPWGPPFDLWLERVEFGTRGLPPPSWRCPPTDTPLHLLATDRAVLETLYRATDGENWHSNSGWLSAEPLEDWYGVERTAAHGRVTSVRLGSNGLRGVIPPELRQLEELEGLYLGGNALRGPIPPELGDLSNLEILEVASNQLSGPIPPEVGQLTNLSGLFLGGNALSGRIPPALGHLSNLEHLDLALGQLSGPIPPELGRLTNLVRLELQNNRLNGRIPREFGQLSHLVDLNLLNNQLSGAIPRELGELTNLRWLDLDENDLSGELPRELTRVPLFEVHLPDGVCVPRGAPFDAWVDELGSDSSFLRCGAEGSSHLRAADRAVLEVFYRTTGGDNWSNSSGWLSTLRMGRWYGVDTGGHGRVTDLSLYGNGLTGAIPPELGQLEELRWLSLFQNKLEGPIPPELGQLSNLEDLSLGLNQLSGPLPPELGQLTHLRFLSLHSNPLLSGPVPDTFLSLTALRHFGIRNTGLCVPMSPAFDAWLESMGEDAAFVTRCTEER